MQDDRFEWDDAKADSNRRKHGVSMDELDDDPDEERWKRVGMTASGVLVVIHTQRGHRIRIISARKAKRHEQDDYYRQAHP